MLLTGLMAVASVGARANDCFPVDGLEAAPASSLWKMAHSNDDPSSEPEGKVEARRLHFGMWTVPSVSQSMYAIYGSDETSYLIIVDVLGWVLLIPSLLHLLVVEMRINGHHAYCSENR